MLNKLPQYPANQMSTPEWKVKSKQGALYLVALSGGADSVYLLLSLLEQGELVEAVHCNFHLRGEESDRDEAFCRELCERKGVKLHVVHFNTMEYATLHKISIELAARRLRYNYFEQLRKDIGAEAVAVAHHKDDQVETILHNMVRGTGIKGLCGMLPQNGNIVRPLLNITRKEIEIQLESMGETYVTDSTNLKDDAMRNKIRHHLVPLLKELNPQAVENIARMARNLAETAEIQKNYYASLGENLTDIPFDKISLGLLHYHLSQKGFNTTHINNIYKALQSMQSKTFESAAVKSEDGKKVVYVLDVSRHKLYLTKKLPDTFQPKRTPTGKLMRRPLPGDRFRPKNFKGTKLVSDYLNQLKLTPPQKRNVIVVESPEGNIIDVIV